MEQFRVLAVTATENEKKLLNILDYDSLNCVGMVPMDMDYLNKAMAVAVDAVVVMAPTLSNLDCMFIEKLFMAKRNVAIILIAENCDVELLSKAMQCGVAKVLTSDMSKEIICENISLEINRLNSRGTDDHGESTDAKIISVFGTKGGTGKTTVAVNLAVAMQKAGKRVAIIDLDLQFGDIGVFMDVPRFETISDLVSEGNFSTSTINSYLYTHSTGVKVLCAPASPELAEIVKPEHIEEIVEGLRGSVDYIVFDLGPTLDECVLQALELSKNIYFITNPEISTLKNTKICLKVLKTLDLADKVRLVLNKDGDSYVKQKDMEAALDAEMVMAIPAEPKNTIAAINRGVPLVIAAPKSKVSKEINRYVASEIVKK